MMYLLSLFLILFSHESSAAGRHRTEKPAQLNSQNNTGATSLLAAAANQDWDTVKTLVSAGANINTTDWSGTSALMKVVSSGQVELVKWFLENDAEVNLVNSKKENALTRAYEGRHYSILEILLKRKELLEETVNSLEQEAFNAQDDKVLWMIQEYFYLPQARDAMANVLKEIFPDRPPPGVQPVPMDIINEFLGFSINKAEL